MSASSTITTELLSNPTPGEILDEEFLKPLGLSQNALARAIGVPPRRINEIVLGKRTVTADTDLRWLAISVCRRASSWACRQTMTSWPVVARSGTISRASCRAPREGRAKRDC
jgi:addiction module HigA family antidote